MARRFAIRRGAAWLLVITVAPGIAFAEKAFPVAQVAPGVYVHHGAQAEASAANAGDIANIGFIVGQRCVAVIDTGGSPQVGRALKAAVARVSERPICYVINTHMHPDHVLGNLAFTDTPARFVAHRRFARALAARASTYIDRANDTLDATADASWIVLPDVRVAQRRTLDLGGRTLRLEAWPTAHTDNDLTVYDPQTRTFWFGDLLFVDRVPSLDGSLTGWIEALDALSQRTDIDRGIPGHGTVGDGGWQAALERERDYLDTLRRQTRAAIDDGHTLEWAIDHVGRSAADQWLLFDEYNARNVTAAYTQLEWQ